MSTAADGLVYAADFLRGCAAAYTARGQTAMAAAFNGAADELSLTALGQSTTEPAKDDWTPGRWWTVLRADVDPVTARGTDIWCQTSSEDEARGALATCPGGGRLYREYTRRESRLEVVT